ncbi:DUF1758 domain-containing protein [Trichonephila clavipes]|nr:DUF1758 domain-containing protein [Trichonephila clavipes]
MTFLRLEVQGKRWCSWQNPVLELLSEKDSPIESVKPTELTTASALASSVKSSDQERKVRVLIDTACENSYISESVTSILNATPLREKEETIIHSLFGGNKTKPKHHSVYSIEVSDLKRSYACCFEVLSEKKICGFISKIEDKRILNELKNKEIILSDLNCKETEIGLLIGADNIGKLLTGNLIEFDSGLTAIETKLGVTVIGKVCSNDKNVMLTTSSLHVRNVSIKELWELDVLEITDPLLNENTKENFELTDFKNKMKILPDGRYEVKLPWKCNSENLPSNKELTWKRHLQMMNKLRNGKFFEDYKSVFRQWENLNIIERVPEVELNNECHYLPHRPVIKLDSATTKIRPVFDASAREKGKPSLNDCLYKGVNLIELIPDILDRFRIYPVGIVADIEKAFLMLSVAPKDRDYLRFFFPCNEKQLVYRHCRVVFGVSSSPYLLNASIMHLLENCNPESMASKSVDKHSGETFILGIIWDLDNDVLKCCTNFDSLTCEVKITKRLVLSTVICECEFLINSRPLTYISENPQELIPLTPAMFLIENRCSDTTDIDELNSTDLRKRMKYRIKLLSDLRQRFRKEYLSELIQKQNDRVREPRIGEMVLIGNDNKKRLSWPIAKIIELIPGRDGKFEQFG